MSAMTINQAMQTAVGHHQAGRVAEAEAIYRQVLAVQPQNPDALHLLGVIALQTGHPEAAIQLITQALAVKTDDSSFHSNLGEAYRSIGRQEEAIPCYERALTI